MSFHHVAEAVVGASFERAIFIAHLRCAVDDFLQFGHLPDVDIHRGPCCAVGDLGVGHRAHLLVSPRVRRGILIDTGTHDVGKAFGSQLHRVGVHDADTLIVAIRQADTGFEGLRHVALH